MLKHIVFCAIMTIMIQGLIWAEDAPMGTLDAIRSKDREIVHEKSYLSSGKPKISYYALPKKEKDKGTKKKKKVKRKALTFQAMSKRIKKK
jgi:hypothetical protein